MAGQESPPTSEVDEDEVEGVPFDRGRSVMSLLWPLLEMSLICLFWWDPITLTCVLGSCIAVMKLFGWMHSWWMHLRLACLVSNWHRSSLRARMKSKGIKFRPRPCPPRLVVLPCRLMVLSGVMMSMMSVAMAGAVPVVPPVTWVEAQRGVRGLLDPPKPTPKKSPDPVLNPPDPTADGEGEDDEVNQLLDAEDVADLNAFDIKVGLESTSPRCHCCSPFPKEGCLDCSTECSSSSGSSCLSDQLDWEDAEAHIAFQPSLDLRMDDLNERSFGPLAFMAKAVHYFAWSMIDDNPSFGPLGLLADELHQKAIVDTGASLTISPHREDFVEYQEVGAGRVIKGLKAGAQVVGTGVVHWQAEVNGKVVDLKLRALHVPESSERLLCPQQLKREHSVKLKPFEIDDGWIRMEFPEGVLDCHFNASNLPVMNISTPLEMSGGLKALNACVTMEKNQNLTVAQKELLKWHCKLGHISLQRVQKLIKTGALGDSPKLKAAANLDLDKHPMICGSCAFGKAKKRTRRSKTNKNSDGMEKLLSKDVTIPGQRVSMDHFTVSTPGRLFNSRGREPVDKMYKGGVIFVDHASSFVFIVPVVNFTAGEALRAKREFEKEFSSMGITAVNYHTDNGVFTSVEFQDELAKLGQDMTFSGVGAHHQNAVAERAIGTTVSLARTMMLHAKMRWPKAVTTKLWPMAMKHAEFLVNHVPNLNNVCPMDVVMRTFTPRDILKHAHVWGAPTYVLDPQLQDGHKIPKFDPRSRRGLHLGWSPKHAASVPLVLNLRTGNVSSQFHVVFDDWFSTVSTEELSTDEPLDGELWTDLLMNERFQFMFDETDAMELDDEWLTEMERQERHEQASARVRARMPAPVRIEDNVPPGQAPRIPAPQEPVLDVPPTGQGVPEAALPQQQREQPAQREPQQQQPQQQREPPPASPRKLRQGSRVKPGTFKGMTGRLAMLLAASNAPIMSLAKSCVGSPAAHLALAGFDAVTETFDCVDYISFKAMATTRVKSKKGNDPDFPTFHQAMMRPDAEEWKEAMKEELQTLIKLKTWTVVSREEAVRKGKKVIKSTWAFRQKRSPDGLPTKKKARCCVRGDQQDENVDYFESYSPVVQWSSVRLMLVLSIVHGLETRQVDYVNAFAQADLNKDVFIEMPPGFEHNNQVDCVLKLNKSLYGMSESPLLFFELLKSNLLALDFEQMSHIDPCLFIHKKAICLTYVDDCLWFGPDGAALDALIKKMKEERGMDLKVESNDVSAFLGIQFKREGDTIELKQVGLIDKVIEATGLQDANSCVTPADPKPLGKDVNGEDMKEEWSYASVVGMLLYLSGNSRPDISFAVSQAARFTHSPKQTHAKAVKKIVRYLKGTRDKGLIFRPTGDWKVDCYVDADFCGLWGSEDPDDPVVAKSRTGYIIMLAGCPLLVRSVLQSETSVSTMMAEYVALSTAMRDMLPLKRLVETISKVVTGDEKVKVTTLSDVFEDNNGALTVATLPKITPQSKFFAVKLHFFREHVKTDSNPKGEIHIKKIETTNQLADLQTKGLVEAKFVPLRNKLMGWDLVP